MNVWRRLIFLLVASCLCYQVAATTEADVVKSMSFNPKIKLAHKLSAFDGILLGFDGGEWGGGLIYLDKQGTSTSLSNENIKGIMTSVGHVFVFSGLAHLGDNEGKISELTQSADRSLSVREFINLKGDPSAVKQVDEQTIAFKVFSGFDHTGKLIYACKALAHGTVSDWDGCATDSSEKYQ